MRRWVDGVEIMVGVGAESMNVFPLICGDGAVKNEGSGPLPEISLPIELGLFNTGTSENRLNVWLVRERLREPAL